MQRRLASTAAALMVGNELLGGKIHEANLVELARTLRVLGISLRRALIVPDEVDIIAHDVRQLSAEFDVVFTSGGVGPTHDDVTIESIARAFGADVRVDETMKALLHKAYGDQCSETHLRMALIPEGAELATTPEILWPTVVMHNVWVLPGVPEIFRMKLSVVRAWVQGPEPFISRAVFTRLDEASLKAILDHVVSEHPEVSVGSYPKWFDPTYKTKVTFDCRDGGKVDAALASLLALLPEGEPQRIE